MIDIWGLQSPYTNGERLQPNTSATWHMTGKKHRNKNGGPFARFQLMMLMDLWSMVVQYPSACRMICPSKICQQL